MEVKEINKLYFGIKQRRKDSGLINFGITSIEPIHLHGMRTNSGKVCKRKSSQKKRRKLRAVLKMLAVMEPNSESQQDPVSEFLVTGRTGRRNAMADILGPHATTSSGDLPQRLETLCTDEREEQPSTESQNQGQPKTDNSCGPTATSAKPVDQTQPSGNS